MPEVKRLLSSGREEMTAAPRLEMDPSVTDFYAFTPDHFRLEGYTPAPFSERIPIAV